MNNTKCLRIYSQKDQPIDGYVLIAITLCIMICNVIANTVMMVGLWKTKRRFTRPQTFYFCLCISDILVGVFNVPLQTTLLIHPLCEIMAVQQFLGFFPSKF